MRLPPDQVRVIPAQIQLLGAGSGDGLILHMDGVGHIGLGTLPGDEVLLGPGLAGHFVNQGDALGLCGEQIVIAARLQQLQQLPAAGLGQLRVAETDECADIQIVCDLADGQLPLKPGHGHGISGHNKISILPQGKNETLRLSFFSEQPAFSGEKDGCPVDSIIKDIWQKSIQKVTYPANSGSSCISGPGRPAGFISPERAGAAALTTRETLATMSWAVLQPHFCNLRRIVICHKIRRHLLAIVPKL